MTQVSLVKILGEMKHGAGFTTYFTFDFGAVRSLSTKYALGANLYYGSNGDGDRVGLKARLRRSLGQDVAIDIAPGILFGGSAPSPWKVDGPGFVGEVSIGSEFLGVAAGVESVSLKGDEFCSNCRGHAVSDVRWYGGVKTGGWVGIALALPVLILSQPASGVWDR